MKMRTQRQTQFPSLRRSLILAAVTMLAVLVPTASSSAATYSVYSCVGPASEPLPNSAWLSSVVNSGQTPFISFGTSCGALSVSASAAIAYALEEGGAQIFDPPAGTTISGYRLTRSVNVEFTGGSGNPKVSAGIRESAGVVNTDRDCSAVATGCAIAAGLVQRSSLALNRLELAVRCVDAAGCPKDRWSSLATTLESARVDLDDPTPPEITAVTGTLPGSEAVAGSLTVHATATDVGGGVDRAELSIDGIVSKSVSAGGSCGKPYTVRQPCPSGLVADFDLDTASLTNGLHIGSVRAVDAAGNHGSNEAFLFTVTSGGREVGGIVPSNGIPAVERPVIGGVAPVIAVRAGAATVTGNLSTGTTPISGARLEVSSLDLGVFGAEPVSLGETTTTADGTFSIPLSARGAQRVTISFRPAVGLPTTALGTAVVRESLKLSIKRSKPRIRPGGSLIVSGRLTGAGAAAAGAPVEIDTKIDGRWRAVGVIETAKNGSYRWKYRFNRVKRSTKFVFRAQVRRNKSWPWPTSRSKAVKVLVAR
jgi:hypothetical protein